MIIQSVTVENFRSFYGEQTVNFSTDEKKNTTVIYALNGVGKTNLLNAILWCLHGFFSPSFKKQSDLLNWQAKENKRKSYHVTVAFEENNENFVVKRSGGDIENFKVFRVSADGNSEEIDRNPTVFINSIVPRDMAGYFISDGEGGDLAVNQQGTISVKRSIRDILGFQVAEKALDDLTKIKREFRQELNRVDDEGKLSEIEEKLEVFENSIIRKEKELNSNKEALELYKTQLAQVDKKLAGTNSVLVKQAHSERKKVEQSLNEAKGLLTRYKNEKVKLIREYSWVAFSHKLSNEALDFIDESELKGTVPAPYNEQLVKDILEQSKCICGAPIKAGTSAYENIKLLLGKAADPNLLNRLQKARSRLTAIKTLAPQARERLEANFHDCDGTERKIRALEERLDELSINIQDADIENINKLERSRRGLKEKIDETTRTIIRKELDIENLKKSLAELKGQESRIKVLSPRANKLRNNIKLIESIEIRIRNELDSTLESIQDVLAEKINQFMERYLRQDYVAKMSPEFQIGLYDRNDELVPPGGGQSAILSFIYISSLIAIARERRDLKSNILTPGAIAPLIFDAPFSNLDPAYAPNVARELPKLVDQLIILMYQDESAQVDKVLAEEGKLGKVYYLSEEVAGPQGSKEVQKLKLDGKEIPVTVYGASKDRVLIKEAKSYV